MTPLHLAARFGHLEVVIVLYEHNADIHARDCDGETPLHETLYYTGFSETEIQVDVLRQLLEYGADSNVSDHNHSTPLHQASPRGWAKVAQLLLSYDARVDEEDEGGRTPFQLASSNGHIEIAKSLLEHGANQSRNRSQQHITYLSTFQLPT